MLYSSFTVAISVLTLSTFAIAFTPNNPALSPNSQFYRDALSERGVLIPENSGLWSHDGSASWMNGNTGESNPNKDNHDQESESDEEGETLKAARFSKFAPDADLPTSEFREQLKENMKADLERRRKEDPGRGNQPTRSYLDNL